MDADLKSLRIDKSRRQRRNSWATRWIVAGIVLFLLLGLSRLAWEWFHRPVEVQTVRVQARPAALSGASAASVTVLDATGYIVAAHKIEVASKVVGKVAWIGVDKGDKVREGQVLVRLEDDEYRAQLAQARGQLETLRARLSEAQNGSRPEEIARAEADLRQAKAELVNAQVTLDRTRRLAGEGVLARQSLDDAVGRFESLEGRVRSLERTLELYRIGPRKEAIEALRGSVSEAEGRMQFAEVQLANTVIKAPVSGTVLDRNVEKGEFVTTGFVGDRGAKGFVVSLADLSDLEVELDINQNDFAKLKFGQRAELFTDAYPDRKYKGQITEISPEANRQKATVQVKVKVLNPDDYLRPEMNSTVRFVEERPADSGPVSQPVVLVPLGAVKNNVVFLVEVGKARKRLVRTGGTEPGGLRVEAGLMGGELLIVNPPESLKDGDLVRSKE
jgi:HlyD family secretion protein